MAQPTKPQLLREKALGYLAQREHAYQELKRKLQLYVSKLDVQAAKAAFDKSRLEDDAGNINDATHDEDLQVLNAALIETVLQDFKQRGWLSEQRFTEQLVHARKSKFGSMRIAHELREKGIAEELVDQAVQTVKDDEVANALAICRKKYHAIPESREEWAKQARFLQSRGFGFDTIKKVLSKKALSKALSSEEDIR